MKDVDDFILTLIRTPAFSDKINDIAVECGNSLYQPELDRYIAGEDISFASVRKVWRNTTQPMCWLCGFFEQFFPLVRAINQKLPPEKRLRVLAGDPPIDWEQADPEPDKLDRNASIASVLEKEVLSKHWANSFRRGPGSTRIATSTMKPQTRTENRRRSLWTPSSISVLRICDYGRKLPQILP